MSSKPYDAVTKDLVEVDPATWPALLGGRTFQRVDLIDADVSTVSAAADKVIRVHEEALDWLLNVEFQAGYDAGLPGAMHLKSTLLGHRHGLLVQSVALLLRREANASNLTGIMQWQFPGAEAPYDVFRYRVTRLWELPVEPLLAGSLALLPLAPLTDEAAGVLPAVVGRIEERLRQEATAGEAAKLRTAAFILLGLRYPKELATQLFQRIMAMEESTTYQWIMEQGRVEELRRVVVFLGQDRFGPPDPDTLANIKSITDIDYLEELVRRVVKVSGWQELLACPPT